MKYSFIKANHSSFSVKKMCQVLNVSVSGFYRWSNPAISFRKLENEALLKRIKELYDEHRGMAGSPIITADLRKEPQYSHVGKNRVARLMKKQNLKCKTRKKYVITTDSNHQYPASKNLLNRKFDVKAPNTVWVSDITYLKVGNVKHYLTVFIDLFSRMIVGWDLSNSLEHKSVLTALGKAIRSRNPEKGLLIHSDQGKQYACGAFRRAINDNRFKQSMSRRGNCWDNAVAESFFKTLKTQMIYHKRFRNIQEAEKEIFRYIEIYYNRRRPHSYNGYKTPVEKEYGWYMERMSLN